MNSTPKWHCRTKPTAVHAFPEFIKLSYDLRRAMKRIILDVKLEIFNERDNSLEECEKAVDLYWSLKDESKRKDILALKRKTKHNPYTATLVYKFDCIEELNDRRFHQLVFVLKKMIDDLLRKSMHSEVWLNWAVQIVQLYNNCCDKMAKADSILNTEFNANICSNMYPPLLLPHKPIDFDYVLKLAAESRIEQNSLDLLLGLFKMRQQNSEQKSDSSCSSLEISRILTLSLAGDIIDERGAHTSDAATLIPTANRKGSTGSERGSGKSLSYKHTLKFLSNEGVFISQIIRNAHQVCPSIFGSKADFDSNEFLVRGMRTIWSYVAIILDHLILWWMDTPLSCYSLEHIGSVRDWICSLGVNDLPEPVYTALRGVGETLTHFLAINIWDKQFSLTLMGSITCGGKEKEKLAQREREETFAATTLNHLGTATGTVWLHLFSHLIQQSNSYFPSNEIENISLVPVAEQIPILHRIDHSVHSARLWVKEQAKMLCNTWEIDMLFRILEHDVKQCLELCGTLKLPKLNADSSDILLLVCTALRAKLICEVNANIDKMRDTTDECLEIMSVVCRTLSLANFQLSFPSFQHWHKQQPRDSQDHPDDSNQYVDFVLSAVYLPVIKATPDIRILELVLKIICQAWLDHIYQERIRFNATGARRLLEDFDKVRTWLMNCDQLAPDHAEKLSDHEVLRMCKGVGRILLRKPEDVIMIKQSPMYKSKTDKDVPQEETHLPAEMFVSNQKHWLQLRVGGPGSAFPWLQFCCDDTTL